MPIIFKGNHTCEKCKKRFEWVYFETIRSKLSSGTLTAEKIPNEAKAHRVERTDNNAYIVFVHCSHCHYDNRFTYENQL